MPEFWPYQTAADPLRNLTTHPVSLTRHPITRWQNWQNWQPTHTAHFIYMNLFWALELFQAFSIC
jgi:hypothetical protein